MQREGQPDGSGCVVFAADGHAQNEGESLLAEAGEWPDGRFYTYGFSGSVGKGFTTRLVLRGKARGVREEQTVAMACA